MSDSESQTTSPAPAAKIGLAGVVIESGKPEFAPRQGGGPQGSKYDAILDKAKELPKGQGFLRVELESGTDADRALANIRTAIKRRLKDPEVRARLGSKGDVLVFRN